MLSRDCRLIVVGCAALCMAASTWGQTLVQTIPRPSGGVSPVFGISLAAHGDTALIIGGPDRAAIYERDPATDQLHRVTALIPAVQVAQLSGYGLFGAAVHGDIAVVGQQHFMESGGPSSSGAVYVFERNAGGPGSWGETAVLQPSDPAYLGFFGLSAVVDDEVIVAAAPHALGEGYDGPARQGAAYVFERDETAWSQTARLSPPGAANSDGFGFGLDIDGDRIAVGAPFRTGPNGEEGVVFVFEREADQWLLTNTLLPSSETAQQFGVRVKLTDDTLVTTDLHGMVEIFRRQTDGAWTSVLLMATPSSAHGVDADERRLLIPSLGHHDRPWGAEFRADPEQPDEFHPHAVVFGPSFPLGTLGTAALMGDQALVSFNPMDDDDEAVLVFRINGFADLVPDGRVDAADLGALLDAWDDTRSGVDLDGDGVVTGADLGMLLGAWGPTD